MPGEAAHWEKLEKSSMNKQHEFFAQYKDKFISKPVSSVGRNIKVGDHIRFPGKIYDHHLICIAVEGNEVRVMEYTGPAWNLSALSQSTSSSDFGRLAGIQESVFPFSMLEEKNAELITWPRELKRFEPDEVVQRAKDRKNENYYDFLKNNCEHFVTWCMCGLKVSLQVKSWLITLREFGYSVLNFRTFAMVAANFMDELLPFLPTLGFAIEVLIAINEIWKACDQWRKKILITTGREFTVKIAEIVLKGTLRFCLGHLGSTYSGAILEYVKLPFGIKEKILNSGNKFQSGVCGAVAGCIGHLIGAGTAWLASWVLQNWELWMKEASSACNSIFWYLYISVSLWYN